MQAGNHNRSQPLPSVLVHTLFPQLLSRYVSSGPICCSVVATAVEEMMGVTVNHIAASVMIHIEIDGVVEAFRGNKRILGEGSRVVANTVVCPRPGRHTSGKQKWKQ